MFQVSVTSWPWILVSIIILTILLIVIIIYDMVKLYNYSQLSTDRSELAKRFIKRILIFIALAAVLFVISKISQPTQPSIKNEPLNPSNENVTENINIKIKELSSKVLLTYSVASIIIAISYILLFYMLPKKIKDYDV